MESKEDLREIKQTQYNIVPSEKNCEKLASGIYEKVKTALCGSVFRESLISAFSEAGIECPPEKLLIIRKLTSNKMYKYVTAGNKSLISQVFNKCCEEVENQHGKELEQIEEEAKKSQRQYHYERFLLKPVEKILANSLQITSDQIPRQIIVDLVAAINNMVGYGLMEESRVLSQQIINAHKKPDGQIDWDAIESDEKIKKLVRLDREILKTLLNNLNGEDKANLREKFQRFISEGKLFTKVHRHLDDQECEKLISVLSKGLHDD